MTAPLPISLLQQRIKAGRDLLHRHGLDAEVTSTISPVHCLWRASRMAVSTSVTAAASGMDPAGRNDATPSVHSSGKRIVMEMSPGMHT